MKDTKWIALVEVAMWLSVGAAAIVTAFFVPTLHIMWFFLIPAVGGYALRGYALAMVRATVPREVKCPHGRAIWEECPSCRREGLNR